MLNIKKTNTLKTNVCETYSQMEHLNNGVKKEVTDYLSNRNKKQKATDTTLKEHEYRDNATKDKL